MTASHIAFRNIKAFAILAGATLLCGFTFRNGGPPELHYADYNNAKPPRGNTVTVCHAHGCQKQESFTFTNADIRDITVLMDYARTKDTPAQERRAIAHAIGWMERRVGPATGTSYDRTSMEFMNASGQLDCVDEATNATSYLLVLQRNGLLRHHAVIRPYSKASFFQWPHMAAMIKARQNGRIYAVDSGVGPNGTNPAIILASKWYINDGSATPERAPVRVPEQGSDNIGKLVEQILGDGGSAYQPPVMTRFSARRTR